jgi:AraC family transcriptional regulator
MGCSCRTLCEEPATMEGRARRVLDKAVVERITDHVVAYLDEAIGVATLANLAGCSLFHFSRVFTRSVGITPHRYVVHLRLQRAIELVREGQSSLAVVAARTGFADQSHLSRWIRRVSFPKIPSVRIRTMK